MCVSMYYVGIRNNLGRRENVKRGHRKQEIKGEREINKFGQ